jgi:hypothetical protein
MIEKKGDHIAFAHNSISFAYKKNLKMKAILFNDSHSFFIADSS